MGTEIWRPVAGFNDLYEVSNLGRVRSLDRLVHQTNRWGPIMVRYRGKVLAASVASNGYLQVSLSRGGSSSQRNPHVLVAEAFIGPRPHGLFVLHHDGNKLNCRDTNLYYGTRQQNADDAIRHGTIARGVQQWTAKLTDGAVVEIRRLAGSVSQKDLAARFGVCPSTIGFVVKNQTWTHV
jgi:hypothetical protein